jgi:glutamate N-acetyltransferase/amino-acid N-acetyltransferase
MTGMSADDLHFPHGFRAHVGRLGLREDGPDLAIVVADGAAQCVGMFTKSRFAGASVVVSRPRAASGRARGIVVVAKNANVATGEQGLRNAVELGELAGAAAGVPGEQIVVSSTGVIGRQYPMPVLRGYFADDLSGSWTAQPLDVATAIMTTDTHPKVAQRQVGNATVVGVAKGVGMIEPDMATMLTYVFTDADVPVEALDGVWRGAVDETFNCLSVDTDTSTSDTAVLLTSGMSGPVDVTEFGDAVRAVCLDLTLQLARDGEGATKLLTVTCTGARDRSQARRVAKAVLNSPLVKTAVHGADPNWGRVAMAVGKCSDDEDIDQEKVTIRFGDLQLYPMSESSADDLDRLREVMAAERVDIAVDLGITPEGNGPRATVYGCDLSDGYVRINADYTT